MDCIFRLILLNLIICLTVASDQSVVSGSNVVDSSTNALKEIGDIVIKLVDSLAKDWDSNAVDLNGISELVSAITSGSTYIDSADSSVIAGSNESIEHGVAGDLTTLQRLGEIAVQLVDSLSLDQDHRVVNLTGITRLMNTISKGSVHLEQQTDSSLSLPIHGEDLMTSIDQLKLEFTELQRNVTDIVLDNQLFGNTTRMMISEIGNIDDHDKEEVIELQASFQAFKYVLNGIIKFDYVINNSGGAYDTETGHFMCPVAGQYFVSLTYLPMQYGNNAMMTVRSGQITSKDGGLKRLTLVNYDGDRHTSSGSVIIHCNVGETIWIESTGGVNINGYPSTMLHIVKI